MAVGDGSEAGWAWSPWGVWKAALVSHSPMLPRPPSRAVLMVWSSSWFLQALFSKSCFPSSTSPPAPRKAKHNLGSLGSSWENSLSLSLISVLEKIGMLFTCFSKPWTRGLCFGLREGKTLEGAAPFEPLSPSVFPPLLQPPQLWPPHSLPSSDSP